MKNKVLLIGMFLILVMLIFVISYKNNKGENNIQENTEEITFGEEDGTKYIARYNENSFVYEIYDQSGRLLFVTPNEEVLNQYIENPELVAIPNDIDVLEY